MTGRPSRRAVLSASAGAAVLTGAAAVGVRALRTPALPTHRFSSSAVGADVTWAVSRPTGAAPGARLPVVLALHGKGGNHTDAFSSLGLADAPRPVPFAVVSVDAGDTYLHHRRAGVDAGAMVATELLPQLEADGLDVSRLALIGWSMGGYGALLLAATLLRGRVRAVTTMSAALWTSPGASAPGAFDDADDFRAHDVFTMRPALGRVPLMMACGDADPFVRANHAFVDGFATPPRSLFAAGGHSSDYWRRTAPALLAFTAPHLT